MPKAATKNPTSPSVDLARADTIVLWEGASDSARIEINGKLELFVDGEERRQQIISTRPGEGIILVDRQTFAELMAFLEKNFPAGNAGHVHAFLGEKNGIKLMGTDSLYFDRVEAINSALVTESGF